MSAWPIPDEVVEALARFVVVECLGATEECVVPSDFDRARDFLTRHRLAVIPGEPTATVWTEDGGDIVDVEIGTDLVEGANYLYRIPGQPITVEKEEREMGEIRFPDAFDIPEGAVCGWCMTPLTAENLATHDVTDEDAKPWEATPEDEPRVLVLHCIDCAISGRIHEDPDAEVGNRLSPTDEQERDDAP